jgi:hypothetical protein
MKTPWHYGGSPGGLLYNNDDRGLWLVRFCALRDTKGKYLWEAAAYYKTTHAKIPPTFDCACQRKENDISHPKTHMFSFPSFRIVLPPAVNRGLSRLSTRAVSTCDDLYVLLYHLV